MKSGSGGANWSYPAHPTISGTLCGSNNHDNPRRQALLLSPFREKKPEAQREPRHPSFSIYLDQCCLIKLSIVMRIFYIGTGQGSSHYHIWLLSMWNMMSVTDWGTDFKIFFNFNSPKFKWPHVPTLLDHSGLDLTLWVFKLLDLGMQNCCLSHSATHKTLRKVDWMTRSWGCRLG